MMDWFLIGFVIAIGMMSVCLAVRVMMYLSRIAWRLSHWDEYDDSVD